MRKTLVALSAIVALPMAATVAQAAPADGKTTGDVTFVQGANHAIAYNAFDYGTANDRGTVTYTNQDAGFTYTASVDHVSVSGDTACFQYTIPHGSDAPDGIEGVVVTFKVVDAGTPSRAPDGIGYVSTRDAATAANQFAACAAATSETTSGNLVVH